MARILTLTALRLPLAFHFPTRLRDWAALHRQRQQLAALDAHQLRDVGLSDADAMAEAQRRPWDAPRHWRG